MQNVMLQIFRFFKRYTLCNFALLAGLLGPMLPAYSQGVKEPRLVEVIISDLSNPFFSHLARQIEASLFELSPSTEVIVRSSGYDLQRQIRQIREAVASGADFLIINAVSTKELEDVIAEAQSKGTRVIAVDVDAQGADAVVTSDNVNAGRLACAYIAERLGGKGKVLMLYGPPVSAVLDRNKGCADTFATISGIEMMFELGDLGGSRLGGLTYMSSLLPRLQKIDAVFSFNDPTSLGVAQAAREAGRDEFFIVSIDASPEGVQAMREKDSLLVASVAQYPSVMAEEAVHAALALWRGETLPSREILVPVKLLTQDMLTEEIDYWMESHE